MTQQNENYLREHYHIWQTLRDGGYCRNLSNGIKEELLRIYRETWDSRMMANLSCDSCVADLVRATFYQFDIYLEQKKKEDAETMEVVFGPHWTDNVIAEKKKRGRKRK